ncbi:MAG: NAD(P)H-hydrate dehydratase [Bacteroidales bacterium]|nr:NAD(P)H-hydrate dehydratase [Bacteroidales bacterium]
MGTDDNAVGPHCFFYASFSMRNPDTTKHDYGHTLIIAGAFGRMGCAILAARAALRSGCGLATVHLPRQCVAPMQSALPEAMVSIDTHGNLFTTTPSTLERYTSVAIGPGIGTSQSTQQALLEAILATPCQTPLILDADALNIMAINPEVLTAVANRQGLPTIVTPHAGEYARLFGNTDPIDAAQRYNLIVVQKMHRTRVIAPWGEIYGNHTGNAAMATAGSGDVLTGILAGCLAQSHPNEHQLFNIATKAVAIHGQCGDKCADIQSQSSVIASDIIEKLKEITIEI